MSVNTRIKYLGDSTLSNRNRPYSVKSIFLSEIDLTLFLYCVIVNIFLINVFITL